MKKLEYISLLFFVLGCASESSLAIPSQNACESTTSVVIENGDLAVGFRPNVFHPQCSDEFSGISTLRNKNIPEFEPVRESATFLNFEHILTGFFPEDGIDSFFTPREDAQDLVILPHGDGVQLIRNIDDEYTWGVSSILTYKIVPPHYIDFEFEVKFHDTFWFNPDAVFFFASYMNWVDDLEINFLGYPYEGTPLQWVQSQSDGAHIGESYISNHSMGVLFQEDAPFIVQLTLRNQEWPRIGLPFFYGLSGEGSVFALLFDRLQDPDSEIRFTVMRWFLTEGPRPVWDWAWVIRNPYIGQEANLRGRLIFKPFVSAEDIEAEYWQWKNPPTPLSSSGD